MQLVAEPKSPERLLPPVRPQPSEAAIRERAYQIFLARNGSPPGDAMTDWLQAEAELRAEAEATPKRTRR